MNKLFLVTLLSFACATGAFAQGSDLFPELKGQFKPAVKTEVAPDDSEEAEATPDVTADETLSEATETKITVPEKTTQGGTPSQQVKFDMQQQTPDEVELERGKISLTMEKVRGTMAYARNYSYCFAEAVVRNDTTQKLDNLTINLTYGKTNTQMTFSGIEKKQQKSQRFMMVGEDCSLIKSMPQYEIKTCKLGTLSSKSCQNRFQFIPPQ